MCGRYDLDVILHDLAARFGALPGGNDTAAESAPKVDLAWRPRYNIAPGQYNPVVVREAAGNNHLALMQWGLVPAWSREAKLGYSTINARAETVASKPTFRKPLASRRCLVPATGYFEWAQGAGGKQPYRIVLRGSGGLDDNGAIFAFAGLYDIWQGPGGQQLHTYAIVTTAANDALSSIHARMPVILALDAEDAWLDGANKDTERLVSLLQPYPAEGMTAYPVSSLVNSPANDRRELINPLRVLAA